MRLTPIDVQQQQFGKVFRGYDQREVQRFLDLVATQLGELNKENLELKGELRRLERELSEHRDREETLREAMLTAQRAIDEIREQAKKEAQLVVTEAEVRAEKVLHSAHARVTKIIDDINELRRQRVRAMEELRGVLSTHNKLLDSYSEENDATGREASVTVFERVRPPPPPVLRDAADDQATG
jgi:cell division initiation protein